MFFQKVILILGIKGNIFPDDMEPKKRREDCKICLFNNSGEDNDTEELKSLWNT